MILYLDTSALVKLYVEEQGSDQVKAASARSPVIATSRVAYVEARAAFARAAREARIGSRDHRAVVRALDQDWGSYFILEVTEALVREAGALAERRALRAYDALHLASALTLREEGGSEVAFLCFDAPLEAAAKAEGLGVFQP